MTNNLIRTYSQKLPHVFVRSVQIPLKFRCRYITPSRALHLLTCMLIRSCWHKKSWSYFDNFNGVFNACFVCLFCLVNCKRKNSYEFTLYYKGDPPSSRISNSENRFLSAVSLPGVPLNINTNNTRCERGKCRILCFLRLFLDRTKLFFF